MSTCLACRSRVGAEPDSEKLAREVAGELQRDRDAKPPVNREVEVVAKALREHADLARHERSLVFALLTRFAKDKGWGCGIAQNHSRYRDVRDVFDVKEGRAVPKLVRDAGFEYRYAAWVDVPRHGGIEQVSWYVHDSELGFFTHLDLKPEGWRGPVDISIVEDAVRSVLLHWDP